MAITKSTFPLVTLVGICHKHERFVIETLESFRAQDYPNVECIIINNIKGDESSRLIREWLAETGYPATFIDNESPLSIVANFDRAIRDARGEFLQLLACDDVLLPHYLSEQVALLISSGKEYACSFSDLYQMWEDGEIDHTYLAGRRAMLHKTLGEAASLREQLSRSCLIPAPSTLYRLEALRASWRINPDYDIEDWPLYLEFLRRGYKFAEHPAPLVKHRMVRGSLGSLLHPTRLHTFHAMFTNYRDVLVPGRGIARKWFEYALLLEEADSRAGRQFMGKVIRWAGVRNWRSLIGVWRKKRDGTLTIASKQEVSVRKKEI